MILAQKALGLRGVVTALLLFSCLCFGGSASVSIYEMGLSIFALVCLLVVIWSNTYPNIGGPAKWFIVAFISLAGIQLIPLPDVVWSGMSQGTFAEGLRPYAQLKSMGKSMSIAPDATLYALIAASPALVVLWLVAGLSESERDAIAKFLVIIAFFQALIGIAQAAGGLSFNMYDYHHPKVAIGLFASRNHFADIILVGTALTFAHRQKLSDEYGAVASEFIVHSLLLVFLIAMIGSASRTGIILFIMISLICYLSTVDKRHAAVFLSTLFLLATSLSLSLKFFPQTGILKTTLARFNLTDDGRWAIWDNSWMVAQSYWPWGAGLGSFRQIFGQSEPLRDVSLYYVNAAHNEYIQLVIEMGFYGPLFALLCIFILIYYGLKRRRICIAYFSLISLIFILLHSVVDYPFRIIGINVVISCLFSFLTSRDDVMIRQISNRRSLHTSDLNG